MSIQPLLTLGFLGNLSAMELLIIGMVLLLIFGRRLPEVGKSLGKGIVEFKKGLKGVEEEVETNSNRPVQQQQYNQNLPPGQQQGYWQPQPNQGQLPQAQPQPPQQWQGGVNQSQQMPPQQAMGQPGTQPAPYPGQYPPQYPPQGQGYPMGGPNPAH